MADLDKCCEALEAADDVLGGALGLEPRRKASLNLSTPGGFDRAVALLASQLRRTAAGHERDAVSEAVKALAVDWPATTAAQRRRLISDSMEAAGKHLALVPAKIEAKLGDSMPDVFRAGRRDARRTTKSPKVGLSLKATDEAAIRSIQSDASLFVTDAMGVRVEAFGEEAARIVAAGVGQGLGQAEISSQLKEAAAGKLTSRDGAYWDVVSGAYVGRGRSWSQLLGYREAEIKRYRVEAVLDRATTQTCRFLHGKEFSVNDGLSILREGASLREPEEIKRQNPWVRVGRAPGQKPILFVEGKAGRVRLATIEEAASGPDDVGRFSGELGERGLTDAGIGFPPYHGLCRSTTIPVL